MTQNRKRGRNCQEDEVEFMPLSKRINNLHINNGMLIDGSQHPTGPEWGPGPPGFMHQHQLPETPPNSVSEWVPGMPQYTPCMSEHQNPHYFNINKLLFEMYVQRLQRGCHQA